MIKIEWQKVPIIGFYAAISGIRLSYKTSSDSEKELEDGKLLIGPKDKELMIKLAKKGGSEAKFRRMIAVYLKITAPRSWWTQMDTYTVGKVQQSESTMHNLTSKEVERSDFSTDNFGPYAEKALDMSINSLNRLRAYYLENHSKEVWRQMVDLLPQSYLQTRVVMLNYEVINKIYHERTGHKMSEWTDFLDEMRKLPLADELIFV